MAGVKGSVVCSVVLAADWFTVGVVVDVEETFEQLPSLLGRQLEHCFPAFTQAQPLHEPVLLHLDIYSKAPFRVHVIGARAPIKINVDRRVILVCSLEVGLHQYS